MMRLTFNPLSPDLKGDDLNKMLGRKNGTQLQAACVNPG
jgi:hypothetical protein